MATPRQNPAENNSPEEKREDVKQTNKPRTPQPNVRTIDTTSMSRPTNKLPLIPTEQKAHTPTFIKPLDIPLEKLTCNT